MRYRSFLMRSRWVGYNVDILFNLLQNRRFERDACMEVGDDLAAEVSKSSVPLMKNTMPMLAG